MTLPVIDYRKHQDGQRVFSTYGRLVLLSISTLVYNAVRIGHKMVTALRLVRSAAIDRVLVVGFGGIGNHLLLLPTLAAIKKSRPNAVLHLVAASQACADLLAKDPNADECSVLDPEWLRSFRLCLKAGRSLAALHPSAILVAAGADPVKGGILALLSRAAIRAGEDWRGRAMFYTHAIPVDPTISELRRNLRLAGLIGAGNESGRSRLVLTSEEKAAARQLMRELTGGKSVKILGVHPGSSAGQNWKRWDIDRFLVTVRLILDRSDVTVVFFVGPDEIDLMRTIESARLTGVAVYACSSDIRPAAALVGCCDLFLSNDSGLRHMASAQGVPTIVIFGPTGEVKNATDNPSDVLVFEKTVWCRPCHYTRWFLACGNSRPCLTRIAPERVAEIVVDLLKKYG